MKCHQNKKLKTCTISFRAGWQVNLKQWQGNWVKPGKNDENDGKLFLATGKMVPSINSSKQFAENMACGNSEDRKCS